MGKKLGVISKAFRTLARYGDLYSVDDLRRHVEDGEIHLNIPDQEVLLGQLFDPEERRTLRALLNHAGSDVDVSRVKEPLAGYVVHKKLPKNVLISDIRCADGVYLSHLIATANSEMVADHVTGEHISGMVLLEAARQMNIAVIDSKFADGKKRYQIISDIQAEFTSFVHPFETEVRLRFKRFVRKGEKGYIDSVVDFYQGGRLCTSIRMKGSAFTVDVARKMEDKSVKRLLKLVGINPSVEEMA